jgi:RepB DNA-primase from phage plasmid
MNTPNTPQVLLPLAPFAAPITSVVGVERDVGTNTSMTPSQQSQAQLPDAPSAPSYARNEVAVNESIKPLGIVGEWIRDHVWLIHRLAKPLGQPGTIVVTGFGEDPSQIDPKTGKPGLALKPKIVHASIGAEREMLEGLAQFVEQAHCNIYMSLVVFRPDLPSGSKGYEKDIIACLGIVADFDDPDASRWAERLPILPNYVLETSAGRFQAFYLFDKPEPREAVKPVAERLKAFARCDHGTSDMSHVWRVPGALNWPNAKKVAEGRSPEPQLVRVVKWDDSRTSLQALSDSLPAGGAAVANETSTSREAQLSPAVGQHQPASAKTSSRCSAAIDGTPENLDARQHMLSLPPELQEAIKRPAVWRPQQGDI